MTGRPTALVLTAGALVSSACFLAGIVLELLGRPAGALDAITVGAIARAMAELRPEGWATAGIVALIATPALGLAATAFEYRGRLEALLATGVLAILGVSLALAILR